MIMRRATDLPTPLRPRMHRVWPRSTEKLTSSRTGRPSNEIETRSNWMMGPNGGGPGGAMEGGFGPFAGSGCASASSSACNGFRGSCEGSSLSEKASDLE